MSPNSDPILVTGSHRSGTTWVGKMLSLPRSIAYIHEPFNIKRQASAGGLGLPYWFYYINGEADKVIGHFSEVINYQCNFREWFKSVQTTKGVLRLIRDVSITSYRKLLSLRPLVKDPIAIMSAGELCRKFGFKVIVMIRHPAGFVSSIKTHQMDHSFDHFLQQPNLLEDRLGEYKDRIKEFVKNEKSLVEQGILLWNIIYSVVRQYQEEFDGWIFQK